MLGRSFASCSLLLAPCCFCLGISTNLPPGCRPFFLSLQSTVEAPLERSPECWIWAGPANELWQRQWQWQWLFWATQTPSPLSLLEMLNVKSTRGIDRLREGAIEGRKEMDNKLLQRTSTELHLCVLYRCRVSNFTRQHLTRMVFPWPPAEPHLYVVSGQMEGVFVHGEMQSQCIQLLL